MKPRRRSKKRKQRPRVEGDIRVLVVDDDPEIRDILRERLFIEGFRVVTADCGEEALAKFIVHQGTPEAFDVVTLDIRMRDLSGRQVLSLLRKIDHRVCILMISGLDDLSQAVQSLSQGADDYLSKPIKIWDIRDRLTTALGRRASLVDRESRKQSVAMSASGAEAPPWPLANEDEAPQPPQESGRRRAGVEWGAAIIPSRSEPDTNSGRAGSGRSGLADRSKVSDPADEWVIDSQGYPHAPRKKKPAGDADDITGDDINFSEPASPPDGMAGPGDPAAAGSGLTPPMDTGREAGTGNRSGARGSEKVYDSDSLAGNRGGVARKDPDDSRASARDVDPDPGGRRGSLPGLDVSPSPLERALDLTHRVETSWEGCEGHGEHVARVLEKLGASLATQLDLSSQDLDGLCLAARIHGLGIQVRREEDRRQWERGNWHQDEPAAEPGEQEPRHAIPGREREDAGLVARFLGALLLEEAKQTATRIDDQTGPRPYAASVSVGQALLARLGRWQTEEQELDPGLRDLLHGHMEELRAQATTAADGEGPSNPSMIPPRTADSPGANLSEEHIDKLLALYEVADGWVHLTSEGIGGLSPAEAFPELCTALPNRLPAHPTSMALGVLRAWI